MVTTTMTMTIQRKGNKEAEEEQLRQQRQHKSREQKNQKVEDQRSERKLLHLTFTEKPTVKGEKN